MPLSLGDPVGCRETELQPEETRGIVLRTGLGRLHSSPSAPRSQVCTLTQGSRLSPQPNERHVPPQMLWR